MICQRTGWCCIGLDVVVVLKEDDFGSNLGLYFKPGGVQCPNLTFDGEKASCGVHDEPWYSQTPCFNYQNADVDPDFAHRKGQPCMLGPFTVKSGVQISKLGNKATAAQLKRLGDFKYEVPA